jgi:hypothetical protein
MKYKHQATSGIFFRQTDGLFTCLFLGLAIINLSGVVGEMSLRDNYALKPMSMPPFYFQDKEQKAPEPSGKILDKVINMQGIKEMHSVTVNNGQIILEDTSSPSQPVNEKRKTS